MTKKRKFFRVIDGGCNVLIQSSFDDEVERIVRMMRTTNPVACLIGWEKANGLCEVHSVPDGFAIKRGMIAALEEAVMKAIERAEQAEQQGQEQS